MNRAILLAQSMAMGLCALTIVPARAQPPVESFSLPPSPRPAEPQPAGPPQTEQPVAPPSNISAPTVVAPPAVAPTLPPPPPAQPVTVPQVAAPPRIRTGRPERPTVAPPVTDVVQPGQSPVPEPAIPTPTIENSAEAVTQPEKPPAVTEPATGTEASNWWLWIAGAAVAAALLLIAFFLRRKPQEQLDGVEALAELPPETAPPPAKPKPAPAPAAPIIPPLPVNVQFTATSARLSLVGVTVGFSLHIANEGQAELKDLAITAVIGSGVQPVIPDDLAPQWYIGMLAAGEAGDIRAEIRLPNAMMRPMDVRGHPMLAPIIAVRVVATGGAKVEIFHVIGRENDPPADRMAPFRLDQGFGDFDRVGHRRIS